MHRRPLLTWTTINSEENSLVWVDQEMLDIIYSYVYEGDLYHAFIEMGRSSN